MKQAFLVDLYDEVPEIVRDAVYNCCELNGNPYYHRWRIDSDVYGEDKVKDHKIVDDWLKSKNLTSNDVIILTGGW